MTLLQQAWFQWLLAVCTILGGLSAVLYFNDRFAAKFQRWTGWGLPRVPAIPITASAVAAYLNTHPRPRALDQAIANDVGAKVKLANTDWAWMIDLINAVGVTNVKELDRLVKKHAAHARLLARSYQPQETVPTAEGVQLVLEIACMEKSGVDGLKKMFRSLKYISTGPGHAEELWADYQRIKKYGG